jgi:hypothetical protein
MWGRGEISISRTDGLLSAYVDGRNAGMIVNREAISMTDMASKRIIITSTGT